MSDEATHVPRFWCDACGRIYTWRERFAGKKVQCQCGQMMIAPSEPRTDEPPAMALQPAPQVAGERTTAAAPADDDPEYGLYDVAPDDKTPAGPVAPSPLVKSAEPIGAAAMKSTLSPRKLTYRSAPISGAPLALTDTLGGSVTRQLVIPGGLTVLGLVLHIINGAMAGGTPGETATRVSVQMVLNVIMSAAAMAMAMKLFDISVGAPIPAAIKLLALALVPAALSQVVGRLVGADNFFVQISITAIVYLPLCFFGFMLLFEMDPPDAAYCTLFLYIVNDWATMFLLSFIAQNAG